MVHPRTPGAGETWFVSVTSALVTVLFARKSLVQSKRFRFFTLLLTMVSRVDLARVDQIMSTRRRYPATGQTLAFNQGFVKHGPNPLFGFKS